MQPEEVKVIVRETLIALGFDLRDPQEAQADMIYLRKVRVGAEAMGVKFKLGLAGILISTGAYILMLGIKSFLKMEL